MPEAGLMRGKRGLIMGVANNRSIAWGIAKAARRHGADLAFTYQGDALKKRVEPLAEAVDGLVVGHCDVSDEASLDAAFAAVKSAWGSLDFVLHAIAFSDKDQLVGRYVETTAENFNKTLAISCYSFTAVAQRAEKLMPNGGSLLTLTYYGAEKWMPHYNVMGVAKAALEASVRYLAADLGEKNIRVNAISSGPIKTLAASGIGDFRYILKWNENNAPLRRSVTIEEVGDTAVYFLCDLSRGVTGEIHHVDAGYHIVGMKHPDAPDIVISMHSTNEKNQAGVAGLIVSDGAAYGKMTVGLGRGGHSSLSPYDLHNTLIAAGPDFAPGQTNQLPTGNIDLAPTILSILGVQPPQPMDGRVLTAAPSGEPRHQTLETTNGNWRQSVKITEFGGAFYIDEGNGSSQVIHSEEKRVSP